MVFDARGVDDPRNVDFVVDLAAGVTEPRQVAPWGAARIEFGDGVSVDRLPVIGHATTRHRYARGGH